MNFRAKLNAKFYIVFVLMLGLVVFVAYGAYFAATQEIMMGDGAPMTTGMRVFLTVAVSVIGLTWFGSFLTMLRQIIIGYAFEIDENGIHKTATATTILAFILIMPIKTIPFDAIQSVSDKDGELILLLDRSKLDMIPFLRIFVRKEYHLFSRLTSADKEEIKKELRRYLRGEQCHY